METLTRSRLYELVWSQPMLHLSKQFGISDVALAKLCKKHNVPRPPRGYWALLAAGRPPKKPALPAGSDVLITIDVEANQKRRESLAPISTTRAEAAEQIRTAQHTEKHELATRVESAFESAKPGDDGRISIHRHTTPHITASPEATERIVACLSVLAYALEAKGIELSSGKAENEPLRFTSGGNVIHLEIEEEIETYEIEPTPEQKRRPSWTWDNKRTRPSGRLVFKLKSPNGTSGRCKWTETESSDAIDLLTKIVPRIEGLFSYWNNVREERRKREQVWEEQTKLRQEKEKIDQHKKKLEEIKKARRESLVRASMCLQTYRQVMDFAEACESFWSKNGGISEDRKKWLAWARSEAERFNPLKFNYPLPDMDGAFDEDAIPIGGPYPKSREIPLPKFLSEIKNLISAVQPTYRW